MVVLNLKMKEQRHKTPLNTFCLAQCDQLCVTCFLSFQMMKAGLCTELSSKPESSEGFHADFGHWKQFSSGTGPGQWRILCKDPTNHSCDRESPCSGDKVFTASFIILEWGNRWIQYMDWRQTNQIQIGPNFSLKWCYLNPFAAFLTCG